MSDNSIVVFGDELGLRVIRESLPALCPAAIIYSCKRTQAQKTACEWANAVGASVLRQPFKSDVLAYADFLKDISKLKPTMGLCFSYDLILPLDLLDIFPKGVFNIHGALLPQYRGANVLNWVLINGEPETGVTLHKMTEKVDCGPIVLQKKVAIDFLDTALTLREKLSFAAGRLIREAWPLLNMDPVPMIEQDESQARTYKKRNSEDGMIDWKQPAVDIYNLIRALIRPWPGAWYVENNEKHIIDYFVPYDQVELMQKERRAIG